MATKNNPVLGYRHCPDCDTRGSIHQAAGRRNQLYQRCDCGCVQANGRLIQSRMYHETEWLDGMKPEQPGNVYDLDEYREKLAGAVERSASRLPVRSESKAEPEKPDFVPESEPIGEEPENQESKKGLWWLAGGLATIVAVVVRGGA